MSLFKLIFNRIHTIIPQNKFSQLVPTKKPFIKFAEIKKFISIKSQ